MLSSGRGYWLKVVFYLIAYALPAAVVWSILGVVLWPLGAIPGVVALVACGYALAFGIAETFRLPLRAPSLAWQVPAQWVRGHSAVAQTITWGALLGPGLVTRNPYAGMWLLPLLIALNHNPLTAMAIGMAVGVVHGGARALGVLNNRRHMETNCSHLLILGAQMRWRFIDGLALLLAAGALAAYTLSLLGLGSHS